MDDTPDAGSASAFSRPGMDDQLIWRPVATTSDSYEILWPEVVVTEFVLGSKVFTFSGICAKCEGIRESRGRRVSSFAFSPAPTSVLREYV